MDADPSDRLPHRPARGPSPTEKGQVMARPGTAGTSSRLADPGGPSIADADQAAGTPVGFINPAILQARRARRARSTTSCRAASKPRSGWTTPTPTCLGLPVSSSRFRELTYEGANHVLRCNRQLCHAAEHAHHGQGLRQHDGTSARTGPNFVSDPGRVLGPAARRAAARRAAHGARRGRGSLVSGPFPSSPAGRGSRHNARSVLLVAGRGPGSAIRRGSGGRGPGSGPLASSTVLRIRTAAGGDPPRTRRRRRTRGPAPG